MKKVLAILSCLLIALTINAQKVKTSKFSVQYLQLPSSPLAEDIKTYNIKSTVNWSGMASSNRATIEGLQLKGYKKELYEKGDIEIEILVEPYYYEIEDTQKSTNKKNSDGTTSKIITYYSTIKHKHPIRVLMTNLKTGERFADFYVGNSIKNGPSSNSKESKWTARSAASKKTTNAKQSLFNANLRSAESSINSKYGFDKLTGSYMLRYIKAKKHDYPECDEALATAKSAFQSYTATAELHPDFESKMKTAIASWQSLADSYDPDAKKARMNKNNTKEMYENIYLGYFFLNDWANCDKTALACENTFKKAAWIYSWKKAKTNKQNRYQINNK